MTAVRRMLRAHVLVTSTLLAVVAGSDASRAVVLEARPSLELVPGAAQLPRSPAASIEWVLGRAQRHLAVGRERAARSVLEQARRWHPALPQPALVLARMHLHAGRLHDADRLLEESVQAEPDNPAVHVTRARLALRLGRDAAASAMLERAQRLAASDADRARGHAALARAAELLQGIERRTAAREADANLARSRRALRDGDARSALTYAERAAALAPDSPTPVFLLALIARYRNDHAQAGALLEALHRADPANPSVNDQLALVLAEQGGDERLHRAEHLAQENVAMFPTSGEALSTLGWVRHLLGRPRAAESALRAAHGLAGSTAESTFYLARVIAGHAPQEARSLLRAVLAQPGAFPHRDDAQALLRRLGGVH